MDEKLKSENMPKRACLRYILRALRAGRCRERRYADHMFIQIYFRMHHFVVKFSKFSSLTLTDNKIISYFLVYFSFKEMSI